MIQKGNEKPRLHSNFTKKANKVTLNSIGGFRFIRAYKGFNNKKTKYLNSFSKKEFKSSEESTNEASELFKSYLPKMNKRNIKLSIVQLNEYQQIKRQNIPLASEYSYNFLSKENELETKYRSNNSSANNLQNSKNSFKFSLLNNEYQNITIPANTLTYLIYKETPPATSKCSPKFQKFKDKFQKSAKEIKYSFVTERIKRLKKVRDFSLLIKRKFNKREYLDYKSNTCKTPNRKNEYSYKNNSHKLDISLKPIKTYYNLKVSGQNCICKRIS